MFIFILILLLIQMKEFIIFDNEKIIINALLIVFILIIFLNKTFLLIF